MKTQVFTYPPPPPPFFFVTDNANNVTIDIVFFLFPLLFGTNMKNIQLIKAISYFKMHQPHCILVKRMK